MTNFRRAPKLYHTGTKEPKDFYKLPQRLMDCVFNDLNGKQGNQIKLITVLLGTKGDGGFGVSEKWICARTGMDQPNYVRARKALIQKGWLKMEAGKLYVNFEAILNTADEKALSPHVSEMLSEQDECDDRMSDACSDDMHNKEKQINNNIEQINNHLTIAPQKELWKTEKSDTPECVLTKLQNVGIDFRQNSIMTIETIIGEKLDFYVLDSLIDRYWADLINAKGKPSSYIFGILKRKVKENYAKEKVRLEGMRLEYCRLRVEDEIDWKCLGKGRAQLECEERRNSSVDISQIADDLFVDPWWPPVTKDDEGEDGDTVSESLRMLDEWNRYRKAIEDDEIESYLWQKDSRSEAVKFQEWMQRSKEEEQDEDDSRHCASTTSSDLLKESR